MEAFADTHWDSPEVDILHLFFQDVSRLPIVAGRHDYLPLTRRIQRKHTLLELPTEKQTPNGILAAAQQALHEFNLSTVAFGNPPLDPVQLGQEVELFLDRPDIAIPPSLAASIHKHNDLNDEHQLAFVELGWRCFYLLALLLPDSRALRARIDDLKAGINLLNTALAEGKEAEERLTEGTLRFAIRIASTYVGCGIPYLDLVQEGYFGLRRAVETYREYLGSHFQQHAGIWIRQRLSRYIADASLTIRLPAHRWDVVREIAKEADAHESAEGTPLTFDVFYEMDGAETPSELEESEDDQSPDATATPSDEQRDSECHKERQRRRVAHARFASYQIAFTPFFSLDIGRLPRGRENGVPVHLSRILLDPVSLDDYTEDALFRSRYKRIADLCLQPRQADIINLRFGLGDAEERTLEQIGQVYGLTRERIRQIESKTLRMLRGRIERRSTWEYDPYRPDRHQYVRERARQRLLSGIAEYDASHPATPEDDDDERETVARLTAHYIAGARSGPHIRHTPGTRKTILTAALRALGREAHYREIYEKAREVIGRELHFDVKSAYSALFYSDQFRTLGNGYFTLADDDRLEVVVQPETGERVFTYAPEPLLPPNAHLRSFFESILVVREILTSSPTLTAHGLLEKMRDWANPPNHREPQPVFDAWYAAGVIGYLEFPRDTFAPVQLTIPGAYKLADVRLHCARSLCRHILRMSELLGTLDRLAAPTVAIIRQLLYGNENAGPDLPSRLAMLAAFEAVQEQDSAWYLTDVGRQVLSSIPAPEIPDFGEVEALAAEDSAPADNDDVDIFDIELEL